MRALATSGSTERASYLLHEDSLVQDADTVGIADGGEAVRDDDGRALVPPRRAFHMHQALQCGLHDGLIIFVTMPAYSQTSHATHIQCCLTVQS